MQWFIESARNGVAEIGLSRSAGMDIAADRGRFTWLYSMILN
jgi:hypothetical protein